MVPHQGSAPPRLGVTAHRLLRLEAAEEGVVGAVRPVHEDQVGPRCSHRPDGVEGGREVAEVVEELRDHHQVDGPVQRHLGQRRVLDPHVAQPGGAAPGPVDRDRRGVGGHHLVGPGGQRRGGHPDPAARLPDAPVVLGGQ